MRVKQRKKRVKAFDSSEAGWYLRLTDVVCLPTLGLRIIKKKDKVGGRGQTFRFFPQVRNGLPKFLPSFLTVIWVTISGFGFMN